MIVNGMRLRMGNMISTAILRTGALTAPVAAIALSLCLGSGAALAEGENLGTWLNTDKKGKIQLRECGEDGLCGEIVWLKDPLNENGKPWRDMLNPDPDLRNRPVIGLDVLIGTKKIGPKTWQGQIYDPEVGKVYYLKHLKVGREQVEIKGCLSTGWPCRTKYWTRAEPVRQQAPEIQTVKRRQPAKPKPAPKVAFNTQQAQPPAPVSPPPVTPKIPKQAQQPAPQQPAQVARPSRPARKPEVTAALPPAASSNISGGYLVQVAARQSHNEALRAFNDLQRRYPQLLGGLAPEVLRADLGQRGIWYRVGVGPMLQQQAALDFCNQLKSAGADCLIRRR